MLDIVLDLDDTIIPSGELQLEIVAEEKGWSTSYYDTVNRFVHAGYDWLAYSGMTADELQACFLKRELLERVTFEDDAMRQAWTDHLLNLTRCYRVTICTARGWHPRAAELTASLLGEDVCERVNLLVVAHDKVPKIEKLRQAGIIPHVFLDDNVREVTAAINAGAPLVGWNRHDLVDKPGALKGMTYQILNNTQYTACLHPLLNTLRFLERAVKMERNRHVTQ